jgi:hypothetical protein
MSGPMLSRHGAFAVRVLLAGCLDACVSIPHDVKETFEPPRPGETSYFVRRSDAPQPEGFAAPAPPPAPTPRAGP